MVQWAQHLGPDFLEELLTEARGRALHQPQDWSSKLLPAATWSVRFRELGANMGSKLRAHPCTSPDWGGEGVFDVTVVSYPQLLQHLKRIISDLCKLYNLPQHPDVEMLDQPLPAEQVSSGGAWGPVVQPCLTHSTQ